MQIAKLGMNANTSDRRTTIRSEALLGAALILVCLQATGPAAETGVRQYLPASWTWSPEAQGQMCGVYAVCRALAIAGTPVEPIEFWKVNFVGNSKGSTPDELIAALRAYGNQAELRSGMTYPELRSLAGPVIANVRSAPEEKQFNHWVCLQATEQGLMVYDGPEAGRIVNPAEFLATWSGLGLVVSRGWQDNVQILLVRLLGIASLLTMTALILNYQHPGHRSRSTATTGLTRIGLAIAACVMFGGLMYGPGLNPGHWDGVAIAAAPYYHPDFRLGTLDDVMQASHDPTALVIDARLEIDYAAGTIGSAVNIPVHADYQEIKQFLQRVPRSAPIVVFCQSRTCGYDEAIGAKLARIGFQNVTVSDLGYVEYRAGLATAPTPTRATSVVER